jgi:hypothetical protein
MQFGYLTIDEVNQALAMRLAETSAVTLDPLMPRDLPRHSTVDAMLFDLDSLPLTLRQEVLAALTAGESPCPAAVHSYNLDERMTKVLRDQHVVVSARLDRKLFQKLRRLTARCRRWSEPTTSAAH